ncbi:MAG: glutaminyl-peptide cyclotransferase, partial [Acidobacteriota bacterium]
ARRSGILRYLVLPGVVILIVITAFAALGGLGRIGLSYRASEAPVGESDASQVPAGNAPPARHPVYSYEVINSWPHDPQAFTQGLVYHQGFLYESTGLNGRSSLRKVALETGQVLTRIDIASEYFAEGLAIFNERAIQLTWQHQTAFVYQLANFQPIQTFSYTGEGWGLTHDGQSLIMSDGTRFIRFLDPQSFQVRRTIEVKDGTTAVTQLNELEYIDGEIFANIWLTDKIVRISPVSGKVNSTIDLKGLLSAADRAQGADVLNGIAFDADGRRLFVTGKLWPKLFEIKLIAKRGTAQRTN